MLSPSLRGRGLKSEMDFSTTGDNKVALFARAWIEMIFRSIYTHNYLVALFARAWIEIDILQCLIYKAEVALFARAWIEM